MTEIPPPLYVGIDVAKAHLDIALRPHAEPWQVANDAAGIASLIARLDALHPALIVLEATGGYERPLVVALTAAALPVAVVNPRHTALRAPGDFAKATGKLAKTDALDAAVLAHFADAVRPPPRPVSDASTHARAAVLVRRRQLVAMRTAEHNRHHTAPLAYLSGEGDAPMIEAVALTKQYGDYRAVDNVTLTAGPGELFGFLGPNGAGKSTTMKMMAGLLLPTHGGVRIAGYDLAREPLAAKARLGYMAEDASLYEKLTGREFLRFIGDLYRVPTALRDGRIAQLLDWFDLTDKANDLVESYSRGMRQKIALGGVLVHDPDVLILDEPTSGLDPRSARVVKDLLRDEVRRGKTVLMSTHILEVAEHMVDRVGIINRGSLVAVGTLAELRAHARTTDASLEDLFLALTGGAEYRDFALAVGGEGETRP